MSLLFFSEKGVWVRVQTCKEFCSCWRNCAGLFRSCNRLIKVYCSYKATERNLFPALHVEQLHQLLFITGLRISGTHFHSGRLVPAFLHKELASLPGASQPLSLQGPGASAARGGGEILCELLVSENTGNMWKHPNRAS